MLLLWPAYIDPLLLCKPGTAGQHRFGSLHVQRSGMEEGTRSRRPLSAGSVATANTGVRAQVGYVSMLTGNCGATTVDITAWAGALHCRCTRHVTAIRLHSDSLFTKQHCCAFQQVLRDSANASNQRNQRNKRTGIEDQ